MDSRHPRGIFGRFVELRCMLWANVNRPTFANPLHVYTNTRSSCGMPSAYLRQPPLALVNWPSCLRILGLDEDAVYIIRSGKHSEMHSQKCPQMGTRTASRWSRYSLWWVERRYLITPCSNQGLERLGASDLSSSDGEYSNTLRAHSMTERAVERCCVCCQYFLSLFKNILDGAGRESGMAFQRVCMLWLWM